jgi:alanine dehydrogenase
MLQIRFISNRNADNIEQSVKKADAVIGGVLIPGAKAKNWLLAR